ncbi:EamA family transporter [Enterococcus sp. LJL90]
MIRILILLLVSTITGSVGALALKKAMNEVKTLTVSTVIRNKWIYIGVFLYIVSVLSNTWLYKYLDYSIAFPMTALSYVWTVIISYFVFEEKVTPRKIIAICLIILGVSIINI